MNFRMCATTGPFKNLSFDRILSIFDEIGIRYFEGSTDGRKHLYPYIFKKGDLSELNSILNSRRCKIVTLSGGWADFAVRDEKIEEQYKIILRQLEFCKRYNIKIIRLFVSHIPSKYVGERFFARVIRNIKRILPELKKYNIVIAFENHGGITATAKDILTIIEGVADERIGINFDPANFVPCGQDPVEALKVLSSYIKHCHLKDVIFTNEGRMEGFENIAFGQGIINYSKIFDILRKINYGGYLSLECEVKVEKVQSLIESIIFFKKIAGGEYRE